MDLNDYEEKIIAKLKADLLPNKSIEIRSYPESFDNYIGQMKHKGGAILVAFQSSFWEPPEGNNQTVLTQQAAYTWQFNIIKKNLSKQSNQEGIYDVSQEILRVLSGFTPDGFEDSSYMFPIDRSFLGREAQYYIYQITMGNTIEESQA